MENSLYKNTDQSFQIARDIYTNGAHSKSVAEITLTTPLTKAIKKGASVTGKNSDGALVVGKVYDDYATGSSAIGVQYKVINIQKNYMNCQVGGLQSPNLQGCLAASGLLNVDGIDGDLSYSYDPTTKNVNKRTIQGFSTSAEEKMYRCDNCPYNTYRKFREYYGFFDYADKWINAAFDGTSTAFSNGNGNFASYGFAGKTGKFYQKKSNKNNKYHTTLHTRTRQKRNIATVCSVTNSNCPTHSSIFLICRLSLYHYCIFNF